MKTVKLLVIVEIFLSILCGCTNKSNSKQAEEKVASRIECLSIDVTEDYIQTYANSFCQSTSTRMEGKDCFIGYNQPLHCIDIINMTDRKPLKQVPLETQGPNGIPDVLGICHYKNTFILKTSFGFCRIDDKGNILSKWMLGDFLEKNAKGYSIIVPGSQVIVMSGYSFLFFDENEGIVALPIYKKGKTGGERITKKILLLSCTDWSTVDLINIPYPEYLQKRENYDMLESINVLPHGNWVIYNFPASSEVFVYDRTSKNTQSYDIPSSYAKPIYEGDITSGFYGPLVYDVCRNTFWRVQERPFSSGSAAFGKPFSISQISSDFELLGEYSILEEEFPGLIDKSPIFTDEAVFFTYNGGEHIGLDNMAFCGLKLP